MLFAQNTARKSFHCIIVADSNWGLENYGTVIDLSVDKVDRAAGNLDSVIESLLLRFQTRKGRKQRRMYVYDSSRIKINKLFAEDPEITG